MSGFTEALLRSDAQRYLSAEEKGTAHMRPARPAALPSRGLQGTLVETPIQRISPGQMQESPIPRSRGQEFSLAQPSIGHAPPSGSARNVGGAVRPLQDLQQRISEAFEDSFQPGLWQEVAQRPAHPGPSPPHSAPPPRPITLDAQRRPFKKEAPQPTPLKTFSAERRLRHGLGVDFGEEVSGFDRFMGFSPQGMVWEQGSEDLGLSASSRTPGPVAASSSRSFEGLGSGGGGPQGSSSGSRSRHSHLDGDPRSTNLGGGHSKATQPPTNLQERAREQLPGAKRIHKQTPQRTEAAIDTTSTPAGGDGEWWRSSSSARFDGEAAASHCSQPKATSWRLALSALESPLADQPLRSADSQEPYSCSLRSRGASPPTWIPAPALAA